MKSLNASATLPGCSSSTMAESWIFIQVVFVGFSLPFRVTVSSTKGLLAPTRFSTGIWNKLTEVATLIIIYVKYLERLGVPLLLHVVLPVDLYGLAPVELLGQLGQVR